MLKSYSPLALSVLIDIIIFSCAFVQYLHPWHRQRHDGHRLQLSSAISTTSLSYPLCSPVMQLHFRPAYRVGIRKKETSEIGPDLCNIYPLYGPGMKLHFQAVCRVGWEIRRAESSPLFSQGICHLRSSSAFETECLSREQGKFTLFDRKFYLNSNIFARSYLDNNK